MTSDLPLPTETMDLGVEVICRFLQDSWTSNSGAYRIALPVEERLVVSSIAAKLCCTSGEISTFRKRWRQDKSECVPKSVIPPTKKAILIILGGTE